MKHRSRYTLATVILALTLSACGGAPGQPSQPTSTLGTAGITTAAATSTTESDTTTANPTGTGNTAATATSPTSPGGQGNTDTQGSGNAAIIDVVVTGGPAAGTYQRRSPKGTCSTNLTGGGSWGNQYSDPEIKKGLSSLQLIVDNTAEAAGGTSEFLTTFTFGEFLSAGATTYTYEGREGEDKKGKSGKVTVEDSGQSAKVTLMVETEDGVKIDATIQCNEIFRGLMAEATSTPGPGDETATLNVTLTGGEPAGTFQATSFEEATCGYGPDSGSILVEGLDDPSDAFTIEYYKEGDPLNKFWLLIPKTKEASTAAGSPNFYVEVNEDQVYYIDNQSDAAAGGTGTVKIQNNGNTATVNFDATTTDGRAIKATINCKSISR